MKILFFTIAIPWVLLGQSSTEIEDAGDVLQILIPAIGLGSTIFYEDNQEGTGQFFKSLLTTQLITGSLKILSHKKRPNGDCCTSFPSGHTSAAFMGAGFIHKRFGWKYSIPAYIGATFVGYSRVQADKHFIEDVVAGAAVGILSSFHFTHPYTAFELSLIENDGIYGINLTRNF